MERSYNILTDENGEDIAYFAVYGKVYSFAVTYVPQELRPWFLAVVDSKLHEVYHTALAKGHKDIKELVLSTLSE